MYAAARCQSAEHAVTRAYSAMRACDCSTLRSHLVTACNTHSATRRRCAVYTSLLQAAPAHALRLLACVHSASSLFLQHHFYTESQYIKYFPNRHRHRTLSRFPVSPFFDSEEGPPSSSLFYTTQNCLVFSSKCRLSRASSECHTFSVIEQQRDTEKPSLNITVMH